MSKKTILDRIIFIIFLVVSAVSMGLLFYKQAMTTNNQWPSDIAAYIEEIKGINTTYSYPYPIMFKVGKLLALPFQSAEIGLVLAVTIFNILAIIIVKYIIEKQTGKYVIATFMTFALFYCSMIYGSIWGNFGIHGKYIGVMSPNPWHNHTYMAARPFMILAFIFGVYTLENYESDFSNIKRISKKKLGIYIAFSISLLLATMSKPSYTLVHMAAVGTICIYRCIRSRFKNLPESLLLATTYIPTIIDLLYQFSGVFTGTSNSGTDNGIGFGVFTIWSQYTDNIPLAILLAAAFPLLVLVLHLKNLKTDAQFRFGWQIYLAGIIMQSVLYEKGPRAMHGNFSWGYICGLFIVFMVSAITLIKDTCAINKGTIIKSKLLIGLQWLVLTAHVLLGCYYFYTITVFGADYF